MEGSAAQYQMTKRLPGRQEPDSAQTQHVDPICLPCSGEEVVIRHLLSAPLTSRMDEAIMGASGGKSQLPASPRRSTMHLLYLHDRRDSPSTLRVSVSPAGRARTAFLFIRCVMAVPSH